MILLTKDIPFVETALIKYKALINTLCKRNDNEYVPSICELNKLHKTSPFYVATRPLKFQKLTLCKLP